MLKFDKAEPFNHLPLLPPKFDIESKKILKQAIRANTALARLDGSAKQLPNQTVLLNAIILQEAKISSEIENIVTTNDELYRAFAMERKNKFSPTSEVLHYQEALWGGFEKVVNKQILSSNIFIEIMNVIKETDVGIRNTKGTVIKNPITDEIIYTPPDDYNQILKLLKNLEEFINLDEEDIDPLIKMAVMHYQFEAIHPFYDGNGRTGRIINILYLVYKNKLVLPIMYLSKYIIENKNEYYRLLREVTENQSWEEWIIFLLTAVEKTSIFTQNKIDHIVLLMTETKIKIREELPNIYSKELLEVIFSRPYCKRKFITDQNIVSLKTAGIYLTKLEDIGIMRSVKIGKEKFYINIKLYNILKSS